MTSKIELPIEGYSKKGHGITSGPKSYEIIGGVKGDVIVASLPKGRRRKKPLELSEVLVPSSERVTPRCPHATVCGGCKWQQVHYSAQLEEKQRIIEKLFPSHAVQPIIGCDEPWHYRTKMEFSFSQDASGERYLGLIRSKGRFIVENIEACFIAQSWISEVLQSIRHWWEQSNLSAFHPVKQEGILRSVTMRGAHNTSSKMVILTVDARARDHLTKNILQRFIQAAQYDQDTSVFLLVQHAQKGNKTFFSEMHLAGPDCLTEQLLGQTFFLSPRAFFQPNPSMAEKMFTHIIDLVRKKDVRQVLDLYCGVGTMGILMAPHVRQVIGVELCPHAVCDAKEIIEKSGLENIHIYCRDASIFIDEVTPFFRPDLVIIDPPRTGLTKQAIEDLRKLAPPTILYLSCNPCTQAEDIQALKGYQIKIIQPFDQFPHTPHVENLVVLT